MQQGLVSWRFEKPLWLLSVSPVPLLLVEPGIHTTALAFIFCSASQGIKPESANASPRSD